MSSFYLKKFYSDVTTTDGDALYLYFIATRTAGVRQDGVSAHLSLADGSSLRAMNKIKDTLIESEESVAFGRNYLTKRNGHSHIKMQLENISIDLQYLSVGSKWIPPDNGILLRRNRDYLSWFVSQPIAEVSGTILVGTRKMEVLGFGYQDVVEMTIPPWRLPITELLWGRAHCGNYTVVYDQVKTKDGEGFQCLLLQDRMTNLVEERRFAIRADEVDNQTQIVHKTFTLSLERRRILEEGPIATDERIRSRFVRNLLARVSGNPEERKVVSDATLCIGNAILPGVAIHERVTWHW
jgi:hypothetical protein